MFSLNETTLLSAINSGSIFSVLNSAINPSWSITYNKVDQAISTGSQAPVAVSGQEVFSPDGWLSVESISDAMVVNSPIEKGSYTSYNKVRRPSEIRVRFVHEGWTAYTGAIPNLTNFTTLSISDLLNTLETMKNTASTYNIETPDRVYVGYDLVHYDYSKTPKSGQTLLTVSAIFQEIMDIGEVVLSSSSTANQPSSNAVSSNNSAINTESNKASVRSVTLDEVKNAWTSANTSLGEAIETTGSGIVSGVNSAADAVSQKWTSTTTSVATQIKNGVSDFVSLIKG